MQLIFGLKLIFINEHRVIRMEAFFPFRTSVTVAFRKIIIGIAPVDNYLFEFSYSNLINFEKVFNDCLDGPGTEFYVIAFGENQFLTLNLL